MENRRQLPRWDINKEVQVWIPLLQGFGHCVLEDLHLKGMCVSFNKPIPHQEKIRMSFALDGDYDFIKVESQIPWKREENDRYRYGLSFNAISEFDRDKICHYIQENCFDQMKEKWWMK